MSKAHSSPDHRYVPLPEAAVFLGMTQKALRKRVERKTIPFRRAGKRLIFDLAELQEWVASLPGVTTEEALRRGEYGYDK